MPGAKRGTGDEEDERHQHCANRRCWGSSYKAFPTRSRRPAPSHSEEERADKHGRADRAIPPRARVGLTGCPARARERAPAPPLQPLPGTASVRDEDTPGRGEAKQRVVEHEPRARRRARTARLAARCIDWRARARRPPSAPMQRLPPPHQLGGGNLCIGADGGRRARARQSIHLAARRAVPARRRAPGLCSTTRCSASPRPGVSSSRTDAVPACGRKW